MHLCSSWDHHSKRIDRICASNHVTMHVHRCAAMCINVLLPYLEWYSNPRSSTSSGIACCVFAPSCYCNHHIKCSKTSGQQAMRRPPLHLNPNYYVDLANKTWKTSFVRYEVAITNLLPSVPTYIARHPQSMLTGIRFYSNRWPYNMVISMVGLYVGRKFVMRWLKILVVKELAPRSWLVTTFHLLITFVQILLSYFVHSNCFSDEEWNIV